MAMFFGRLSAAEIKAHFTHVGWYFFVPVYLGLASETEEEQDGAEVAVRNGCPEWLMDVADAIFRVAVVVISTFNPDYEPMFPFRVTGRIIKD